MGNEKKVFLVCEWDGDREEVIAVFAEQDKAYAHAAASKANIEQNIRHHFEFRVQPETLIE